MAAKAGASDRVAREAAAMSAEMMSAAMMSMEAVASAATMTTAMPATVPSSMAAALGEYVTRQRQNESKNRNSQRAPGHGTLPAVTPLTTRRK